MPLQDLGRYISLCQEYYESISDASFPQLPDAFMHKFCTVYEAARPREKVTFRERSFRIKSPDGYADISDRWLLYAYAFAPLYRAVSQYKTFLNRILSETGIAALGKAQKDAVLKCLPGDDWEASVDASRPGTKAAFLSRIAILPSQRQRDYFHRFLTDKEWWLQGKNFSRSESDWFGSSIRGATGVIQANADRLPYFIGVIADNKELRLQLRHAIKHLRSLSEPAVSGGRNVIFYGAPGTGKSHRIDKVELGKVAEGFITRTVFHSETQSSDFVGCLKPAMQDRDGQQELVYTFQPGPFSKALANALNQPQEMHYLVIEEINRAPAAAVFGEIFQLLDRNEEGSGTYGISAADPMLEEWLRENVLAFKGKIRIPSNLTLLATMNSSDQAVMPMDTAFKRRWRFEYIPIDFETICPESHLVLHINGSQKQILWKEFASSVNAQLSGLEIPEDRHLGQWFVSDEELKAVSKCQPKDLDHSEVLTGKLFMYLWDDVLRHGQREAVFDPRIKTYGALVAAYKSGQNIFNDDLTTALDTLTSPTHEEDAD